LFFCFFLHKSAFQRALLTQKATLYEDCTHLDDAVKIDRNTDGQGYDADGHRDCQLD
jgi:hypothetical protein